MSTTTFNAKNVPKLENDAFYETWKRDIEIWRELTDLPKEKQALAIHLSLTGRARVASSEIDLGVLKTVAGVENLILKLDNLFLVDKGRRQFSAFHNLYNLRRIESVAMKDFVAEFEHNYFKFKREDMTLPDPVMAFMLLSACSLSENETHLVMSALNEVSYKDMKSIIMRVFGTDIKRQTPAVNTGIIDVKTEPAFHSMDDDGAIFFTRGYRRGRGGYTRTRGRGLRNVLTGANSEPQHSFNGYQRGNNRKNNPLSHDGKVSRCIVCDSKLHWARNCPHSYENLSKEENKNDNDDTECVHLSLFMGFANNDPPANKLSTLLSESENCALLDTGCSTTVCGTAWLGKYMASLTDFQRAQIVESVSDSNFTFGDGSSYCSLKRVILPCYIGGVNANVTTDVVDCNIPLLLSSKSIKKTDMIWNFKNDSVQIGKNIIMLEKTSSGHYLLRLSM